MTTSGPAGGPDGDGGVADAARLRYIPLRHPLQWVLGVVVSLLLLGILWSLLTNKNFDVSVVLQYLFHPSIIRGVGVTLMLTGVSMVIGLILAVLVAVARLSGNRVLATIAAGYAWFFRGTPLLVQIIFWGFLGALYQRIVIGVPFTGIVIFDEPTAAVIPATTAAIIALSLNEAAYASEIVRAGLLSVDRGQNEAAAALGLTKAQTMRTIVLPQAMRIIIPPMGNQTISMLKATSLVAIVGGQELLTAVQAIYSQNFKVIPLLAVGAIWYLFLVTILSIGQSFLERRFGRGASPASARGLRQRLLQSAGSPA